MLDRCGISVLGFARCCWFGYACECCCVFVGYGALAMLVLIVLCWFLVAAWYEVVCVDVDCSLFAGCFCFCAGIVID